MENRSHLSTLLIVCGTLLVVASLGLIGYLHSLAAADVRDHRTQSSVLLRDATIERVTLSQWEPPEPLSAYATIAGGFVLIMIGIRKASPNPLHSKTPRRDDLE